MLNKQYFKKPINTKLAIMAMLAFLPFLYQFDVVKICKVDVPFGDQWDFVPLLEKSYSGPVTIGDLFAQHNEHRLFFPRIAMLILAHQSQWKIKSELGLIQLLSLLAFCILIYQTYNFLKSNSEIKWFYALPFISLLFFCLSQWENWIWGWQIQVVLSVFSAVFGFSILCANKISFIKICISLVSGTLSFFSYSNGFLFFVIGFFLLFALKHESKLKKYFYVAFFFIYSSIIFLLFISGYKNPENHPSVFSFINDPAEFIKFILKYIGAAVTGPRSALYIGVLGVVVFIVFIIIVLKSKMRLAEFSFWGGLSLYSLGSAFISGIGRSGFGSGQAMSPRYASFSILFWISIFVLIFKTIDLLHLQFSILNNLFIVISLITILMVSYLAVNMNAVGTVSLFDRKKTLDLAKLELLKDSRNPEILKTIYPPGAFGVERQLATLKRLKLSVFR